MRGFWAGWGATAVRDAPYAGVFLGCYEGCKSVLGKGLGDGGDGDGGVEGGGEETGAGQRMGINFASGMVAAVVASAVTNPFDAVKTRLQLWPGRYGNLANAATVMVREEGWGCLWRGMGLRVGRKAVSSAAVWCGYEELVRRGVGAGVGGSWGGEGRKV